MRTSTARASWYAGSAIDPRRARLLVVGSYSPSPPELYGLDGLPLPRLDVAAERFLATAALRLTCTGTQYDRLW